MRLLWRRYFHSELYLFSLLFLVFLLPILSFRIAVLIRLQLSLQACQRHGIELDIAKFAPSAIPPEENASLVIDDAIGAIVETQENLLTENDAYSRQIHEIFSRVGNLNAVPPSDIETLRDAIQPYEAGIAILSASMQLERARFDTDFGKSNPQEFVFPNSQQRLQLAEILHAGVLVSLEDGDVEKANLLTRLLFRYAVWCAQESPNLVHIVIGQTITQHGYGTLNRLLRKTNVPKDVQRCVLRDILQLREFNAIETGLKYEVAYMNELYSYMAKTHTPLTIDSPSKHSPFHVFMMMRWLSDSYLIANRSAYLDYAVEMSDVLPRTAKQRAEYEDAIISVPQWAILVRMGGCNYKNILIRRDALKAFCDFATISFALLDYQKSQGSLPGSLDETARFLPSPIPTDVFTGDEYYYQKQENGFTIYSTGPDFDDDGGKMESDSFNETYDGDIAWTVSFDTQPSQSKS